MKGKDLLKSTDGVTLVELMIVMALSLLLMAAVYLTSQVQKETSDEQHQVMAAQQDLRAVVGIIERDILNAGCDPQFTNTPNNRVFGIQGTPTSSTTGTITVTSDLNSNGALEPASEQAVYSLSGGAIRRNGNGLVNNATNLQFTFFDANDNPTTAVADIRSIELQVSVESENEQFTRTLTRRIKCRNVKI